MNEIRIVKSNVQPRLVTVNCGAFPNDYDKNITVWDDSDIFKVQSQWTPEELAVLAGMSNTDWMKLYDDFREWWKKYSKHLIDDHVPFDEAVKNRKLFPQFLREYIQKQIVGEETPIKR